MKQSQCNTDASFMTYMNKQNHQQEDFKTIFYVPKMNWGIFQPVKRSCSVVWWYGNYHISVTRRHQTGLLFTLETFKIQEDNNNKKNDYYSYPFVVGILMTSVWMLLRQSSNYNYLSCVARKGIHVLFKKEKRLLSSLTFRRWESFWEEAEVPVQPFVHRGCQNQQKIRFLQLLLISVFWQSLRFSFSVPEIWFDPCRCDWADAFQTETAGHPDHWRHNETQRGKNPLTLSRNRC